MARFDRLTVYNTMIADGLVPLFYHPDPETSQDIVDAIARGGAQILEFTNRGDFAIDIFRALTKWVKTTHPTLILGVGSIEDAPTAALYIANGANFIVGPNFNPHVAQLCNRRKIPYLPGCGTVTEIAIAEEAGVEIVKAFPGSTLGSGFVKAIRGPRPWTSIMPTGGVSPNEDNLRTWFEAGVACVGMGSQLVRKDLIASGAYDEMADLVRQTLLTIKLLRG